MEKGKDREVKDGCIEKLVKLNRVTKVVKGGKRFSFSALVVVGYGDGRVGYGFGKANDVSDAIRKATDKAKAHLITVPLRGSTIPHDIVGNYKSEFKNKMITDYKNLLYEIAFVNPNDYSWVFYGNSFVQFYISENANAYYYNSTDELDADRALLGTNTIVVYPDSEHAVPYGAKAYWINDFHEE